MSTDRLRGWLESFRHHGVFLDDEQIEKMVRLDSMVASWNRVAGLSGFRTEEERWNRYFGEALHACVWLPKEGRVVDVGSGGGSPGLPMAIHRPDLRWTLLEPNRKKAVFLEEATSALGLKNLIVERSRFQEFQVALPVRTVTSRGLAWKREGMRAIREWLEPGGILFLFTGERAAKNILGSGIEGWNLLALNRLAPGFQASLLLLERTPCFT